ncbi:MAG: TatD family hydrolase [Dehalococcoidales bacterium]|nr:TatD family hydrolase [Dehalococcoidales bacterium]
MSYSDSHCHLDSYRPDQLAVALEQARQTHVDTMVNMGSSLATSAKGIRIALGHEGVRAAVGIHPWNAMVPTPEIRRRLEDLVSEKRVVAIGEIGLDYARQPQTSEIQKELLRYELSLARETGLPVNIHCREAHQDMMDILHGETAAGLRGAAHGFTGDLASLKDWLDLGFYISLGVRGFVTNERTPLLATCREIPLDHLLVETDSVAGEPLRTPADVVLVVEKIASIKRVGIGEITTATTDNLKRLLKL